MTYQGIAQMVESIGLPCAYSHFEDDTVKAPPYICWIYPNNADFYADNSNYQTIELVQLELYTKTKSISWESAVEAVLSGYGISWAKNSGYLDDEQMNMTTWQFDVVITPEPN